MVQKRYCDVCGKEIPKPATLTHEEAAQAHSGVFRYAAITIEEEDDLCKECGAKVRDFIRKLKEARMCAQYRPLSEQRER